MTADFQGRMSRGFVIFWCERLKMQWGSKKLEERQDKEDKNMLCNRIDVVISINAIFLLRNPQYSKKIIRSILFFNNLSKNYIQNQKT